MKVDKLDLSILIVSYETLDYTVACIDSVLESELQLDYEILVWDNASKDGSAAAIEKRYEAIDRLTLFASEDNLGFAKANNELAKKALGQFVLLLNPDTRVFSSSIASLVEFARQYPTNGIWGGKTLFEDGSINRGSCWSKQTIYSLVMQAIGLSSIFRNSTVFNPEGIGG